MRRRNKALSLLCALVMLALSAPAKAENALPELEAAGAVVLEAGTGRVMGAKRAHTRLPMASTTKVMTAILALENTSPDDVVTVTKEAYGVEGSSMYLELGEKLLMQDLLYGLMLASGNDAAVAIAVHIDGSVEKFAVRMNAKAQALGLTNTHFVTPNGLHDEAHYTTAYDLAIIAAYAMQNEAFRTLVSSRSYTTQSGNKTRVLNNRNKTLWQFDGGNGVKTGYTSDAGKCLVFAARRGDMQLVGVVLRSKDTYGDAFSLLNYGFSNYSMRTVIKKGQIVDYARTVNGKKNSLALCAAQDIMIPARPEETLSLRTQIHRETALEAPLERGRNYGELILSEDGRLIGKAGLYAAEDVARIDIWDYFDRCVHDWSA